MAYSDYGGYAFRNGERVVERSDAVLSPEGIKSTPGMWPGWLLEEGRRGGSYHALLGDGPIFVGLHKQSTLTVHRLGEQIDLAAVVPPETPTWRWDANNKGYIEVDHFKKSGEPCVFEIDGHRVTAYWLEDENHYQFVQLEQPNGTRWHGWSGYGVGAGLEDCGYGYDTDLQTERLEGYFPGATTGEARS